MSHEAAITLPVRRFSNVFFQVFAPCSAVNAGNTSMGSVNAIPVGREKSAVFGMMSARCRIVTAMGIALTGNVFVGEATKGNSVKKVCILNRFCSLAEFGCLVDCPHPTCSGHGFCFEGNCICKKGWKGLDCAVMDKDALQCLPDCSGHGSFDLETQTCTCEPKWSGDDCSKGVCVVLVVIHLFLILFSCRVV